MSAFGDRLRQARQARGIALDDVANATHIARRYLDALERSDLGALPGGAFNRGYIRTYSQYLGIDPQPILEAYGSEERQLGIGTPEYDRRILQDLARLVDPKAEQKARHFRLSSGSNPAVWAVILILGIGGLFLIRKTGRVDKGLYPQLVSSELSSPNAPPRGAEAHQTRRPSAAKSASPAAPDVVGLSSAGQARKSNLTVTESHVGTGVSERAIVGENDRFPEGTRVCFLTRVVGGHPGEALRHVWTYAGRTVAWSELTVGGPHWRTHSTVRLAAGSGGRWAVEALSADGRVLARKEFLCEPPQLSRSRR